MMKSLLSRSLAFAATFVVMAAAHADINPQRLLVLDVEHAGSRLVAVGERGTVFWSDDSAAHWNTVQTGVTRTLTHAAFADAKTGVAVGHGGTVLRTVDGGLSWKAVDVSDAAGSDSLLDVLFLGDGRFVAVGAFGLYLDSSDNGLSWQRRKVLPEDGDAHLLHVFKAGDRLMLAGEAGTLLRSTDLGQTWQVLPSPYKGSFFGGLSTADGALLIYGMRGNIWRSTDGGDHWQQVDIASKAAINGGAVLADGRILLSGNGGLLLLSSDGGASFQPLASAGDDLACALALGQQQLLTAGGNGLQRIAFPSPVANPVSNSKPATQP